MRKTHKTRVLLATFVSATLLAGVASATPALDAAGKCRDNGRFVATTMCQTTTPAGGKCRDIKTKRFAKCGAAGTEPVPTTAPGAGAATAPPPGAK